MAYQRAQVEECMRKSIRYVRLKEGAQIFGMGLSKFQVLAREAKATYKYMITSRIVAYTLSGSFSALNRIELGGSCDRMIVIRIVLERYITIVLNISINNIERRPP